MFKKTVLSRIYKIKINSLSTHCGNLNDVKLDILSGKNTGIYVISLNRPSVKNAVNRNLMKELSQTFESVSFDTNVKVVILRSQTPGIFCSGADLKERITLSPTETYQTVCKFRALTNQIEATPIPVIAAIDGFALGGGFEIALACDIRVASTNAKFGLVETKLAIIPGAGGTQRLPRIVGPSIAKELIFTARIIDAHTAQKYGVLNHVVVQNENADTAYEKALQVSQEILPNGPVGIKMAKTAINKGLQVDLNAGCAIEEMCYAQVIPTKDRLEGLEAFLNKRSPKYVGE